MINHTITINALRQPCVQHNQTHNQFHTLILIQMPYLHIRISIVHKYILLNRNPRVGVEMQYGMMDDRYTYNH